MTVLSIFPSLGPDGDRVNRFRSIGYGVAGGFNLASLVSLACKGGSGGAYEVVPLVCFFLFPVMMGVIVSRVPRRWFPNSHRSEEIALVCKLVVEETDFTKQITLGISKNRETKFYAALALQVNRTFAKNIHSALEDELKHAMGTPRAIMMNLGNNELVVNILQCVQSACAYPIGVKCVFREHVDVIVNVVTVSAHSLRLMIPPFCRSKGSLDDDDPTKSRVMKELQDVLGIFSEIIPRCVDILTLVVSQSVIYKQKVLRSHPKLVSSLLDMVNSLTCVADSFPLASNITRSLTSLLNLLHVDRGAEASSSLSTGAAETPRGSHGGRNKLIFAFDIFPSLGSKGDDGRGSVGDRLGLKVMEVLGGEEEERTVVAANDDEVASNTKHDKSRIIISRVPSSNTVNRISGEGTISGISQRISRGSFMTAMSHPVSIVKRITGVGSVLGGFVEDKVNSKRISQDSFGGIFGSPSGLRRDGRSMCLVIRNTNINTKDQGDENGGAI